LCFAGVHADVLAQTGSSRDRLVVSQAWLAEHINDADLVLLHVGEREEYASRHLPGARYFAMDDVSLPRSEGSLTLQLPPVEELRQRLAARGISDDSRIVVYWGTDWVSPSTRIVLALDYAGFGDRTSILDGGMPAWVAADRAVTSEVPEEKPGRLTAKSAKDLIVDVDWVAQYASSPRAGYALVDARDPVFYDGVSASQGRNGHIPNAVSVPFGELVEDESLHIASNEKLRQAFERAGVKPGDIVVGYCHIGQQATAMLFAARLLGHEVRLFDGSMQEWAREPSRQVVKSGGS
jgi:thiosulfate/3-mercaptopyruvate sulfurtransferase